MKCRILFALVAGCIGTSSAWSGPLLLLSKTNYSGKQIINSQGRAEPVIDEICKIYADSAVVFHATPSGFTKYSKKSYSLPECGIEGLIAEASLEQLHTESNDAGVGPRTFSEANWLKPDGNSKILVLYSTGGSGNPKLMRKGGAAMKLRDLLDSFCPTTHP